MSIMKKSILKTAIAVCAWPFGLAAPVMAQTGPVEAPKQSCDASTTAINARVAITREQVQTGPDQYVTVYYEGWNGNCWDNTQDAFVLAALPSTPITWSITLYDPQNLGLKFSDATGICEPINNPDDPAPNAELAVVFGTFNTNGSIKTPLSNWPIPGLPPAEQDEFGNFEFEGDYSVLNFTDRDNDGNDYHFGVYVCDPDSPAIGSGGAYVFVSDPGAQNGAIKTPVKLKRRK